MCHSSPSNNILEQTKLKVFADIELNLTDMQAAVIDMEENIVGKEKKCWLPASFPILSMFSSLTFSGLFKLGILL